MVGSNDEEASPEEEKKSVEEHKEDKLCPACSQEQGTLISLN